MRNTAGKKQRFAIVKCKELRLYADELERRQEQLKEALLHVTVMNEELERAGARLEKMTLLVYRLAKTHMAEPQGIKRGKSMAEIDAMAVAMIDEMMKLMDWDVARVGYTNGLAELERAAAAAAKEDAHER